jgi:hypothetical protein
MTTDKARKPPRELWITFDEFSNRALTRDFSEKYDDDVDGMPSTRWTHFREVLIPASQDDSVSEFRIDVWLDQTVRIRGTEQIGTVVGLGDLPSDVCFIPAGLQLKNRKSIHHELLIRIERMNKEKKENENE